MLSILLDRVAVKPSVPIAIKGDSGVGKTSEIESWAKRHGMPCVKLLTSTMDETDCAGIVVRDGDGARTLSPSWIKQLQGRGVLFLDELNCGRKEVVDTLLTLVGSRQLPNGDKLGDGVMIIAAMNDAQIYDNYELSPAMRTRFMWVQREADAVQWADWLFNGDKTESGGELPEFQTLEQWLRWFRSAPENGADKKSLIKGAIHLGLRFDAGQEFAEKERPTCPRALTNLLYWAVDAADVVCWAPAFIDNEAVELLRSVGKTSALDTGNAVWGQKRKQSKKSDAESKKLEDKKTLMGRILAATESLEKC